MKSVLFLVGFLVSLSSEARIYRCKSGKYVGFLHLSSQHMSWEILDLGDFALGKRLDVESAPFSEWKGYERFEMYDDTSGDQTELFVAVDPEVYTRDKKQFNIFTYEEHEDHPTRIEKWACKEVR